MKVKSLMTIFSKTTSLTTQHRHTLPNLCFKASEMTRSLSSLSSYHCKIGTREVVGFGMNGNPEYIDSIMMPYPAIRFREINPDFKALKEKEKGSWKTLTMNEKKCLYRISFCKTISEIDAPTGEWKQIIGSALIIMSIAMWFHLFITFMTRDELPASFKHENQVAQLKRILDLRMNPITGISSKWDYEKNNWKGYPARVDKKEGRVKKSDES